MRSSFPPASEVRDDFVATNFDAAYATYAYAYATANFEALKSMADIVRQNLKFPMVHP